jgi:hypothetical protein
VLLFLIFQLFFHLSKLGHQIFLLYLELLKRGEFTTWKIMVKTKLKSFCHLIWQVNEDFNANAGSTSLHKQGPPIQDL